MLIKTKEGAELAVCFRLSRRFLLPCSGTPCWCGAGSHLRIQNQQASTCRCHLVLEAEHRSSLSPRTIQRQPKLYITVLGLFPSTGSTKNKNLEIGHWVVYACMPRRQPTVWDLISVPGITAGHTFMYRSFLTLPLPQRASA